MKRTVLFAALLVALSCSAFAGEGPTPNGIKHLDHAFVIVMENHGYGQIVGNPNAPFINQMANSANMASNYYAVAHPSLTNYLEIVGGSNFGVLSDNYPDWHNLSCTPNIVAGTVNTDAPASPVICPISGTGTDAATTATDCTNEVSAPPCENNIDGVKSIAAATGTLGKTIGDQLAAYGHGWPLSWKTYQESLPLAGPNRVNISDGFFTNNTNFAQILPALNPALSQSDIVALYAAKHNPFIYFQSVQEGHNPRNSFANVAGFDGDGGFYGDLESGNLPALSFIAPNQCNDQHGRGNAGKFCNYDPTSNGSQAGLNPALIYMGDVTVQRLVTSIRSSDTWKHGNNAIVVVWDENDYSTAPNDNRVLVIVENSNGPKGVKSSQYYNHFSLLKSLEGGFGLPCLNHACDAGVSAMTDLFGSAQGGNSGHGDNSGHEDNNDH